MNLHLFHYRRPHLYRFGPVGVERGNGHGAVHCRRSDDPAENHVLRQPGRVGREYLGLVHHFPARGFVPDAQQRVAAVIQRGLSRPPGFLNPVAAALEGIAGDGDAAAAFASEQPREIEVQPGLVCTGGGIHKAPAGVGHRPLILSLSKGPRRAPQAGQYRRRASGPVHGDHRPQDGVGADFHTASTPISASVSTFCRKATGDRTCRRQ